MSMAGMMITPLSVFYESAEVGEYAQSQLLTLFRMKLAREQMIRRNAGDERTSVLCCRGDDRNIVGHYIKRMHEINIVAAGDSFHERRWLCFLHAVPAHVRHLETAVQVKAHDFAGK